MYSWNVACVVTNHKRDLETTETTDTECSSLSNKPRAAPKPVPTDPVWLNAPRNLNMFILSLGSRKVYIKKKPLFIDLSV